MNAQFQSCEDNRIDSDGWGGLRFGWSGKATKWETLSGKLSS